jgi:hypothetical protein
MHTNAFQLMNPLCKSAAAREAGGVFSAVRFMRALVIVGILVGMAIAADLRGMSCGLRKTTEINPSVSTDEVRVVNKIPKLSPRLESLENRLLLAVEHGLSATYFNSPTPGTSGVSRTDQVIDFYWGSGSPAAGVNSDNFSARWVGQLQPRYSETYTFSTRSDAGIRVWVDGKLIIDAWSRHSLRTDSGTIALQAGKRYDLKVEYWEYTGTAVARLLWASPSQAQEDVPASQLYAQGPMTNPAKGTDVLIQAEDFDLGNAGVAYADSDAGNTPGMYRGRASALGREVAIYADEGAAIGLSP